MTLPFLKDCRRPGWALIALTASMIFTAPLFAQRGGRGGAGLQPGKTGAPVDITGNWVSVVTEDWRWRMVTPKKGDHPSIPLNAAGVKLADEWDSAKDEASGEQCKAYGAAGVMRLPGRLQIKWQDDNTLEIDTDAGTQKRALHFLGPQAVILASQGQAIPGIQAPPPSWQGLSIAQWEYAGRPSPSGSRSGDLKVVTTHMRAGYLQKNGVPYSANAVLTEYFNRTDEPNGNSWLILVATVEDPQYLNGPFFRSTHYKREPDGSKWDLSPCEAK